MHVSDFLSRLDLSWFLQLLFTLILLGIGFIHLLKNTASKYFEVDANFDSASPDRMPVPEEHQSSCASCGSPAHKKCSRCKLVKYCSQTCQSAHWKSGHKTECKDFQLSQNTEISSLNRGRKTSGLALVPSSGTSRTLKQTKAILFPYDEFVELFNWDMPELVPCGLLNTGNSCYANVILQCLTYTQPLTAYLLGKGHRRECRRDDWCFLCVLQTHIEKVSQSPSPFSPLNILSRLRYIGGGLGSGDQEDAHEFMRFAIDTMQSVCLDEFGGEKAVSPSSQETSLIQHIFGGHLQSQVVCSNCNQVSNQYENMMDLTVEIQGDASTLEECLEQFTVKEWLHGENMYKCDGCNDYVKAWKRLTVRLAPNILTIALKRFRGGRFGKLNKKITFPETLDLNPYMSQSGDGRDIYKLYAVVVHLDLLNAAYFGHYVCYIKDFRGHWYRIDDEKVFHVELDEVLSQGAYMLLYRRGSARASCLRPSKEDEQKVAEAVKEAQPALTPVELFSNSGSMDSESDPSPKDSGPEKSSSLVIDPEYKREGPEDMDVDDPVSAVSILKEVNGNGYHDLQESTPAEHANGFVSHHVSSSKLCFNKSSNVQVDLLSADFIIEDGSGSTSSCTTGAVPMVSSTENTMSLQNGVSGDDVASPAMDDLDKLENGKVLPMPSCSRNLVGNIAKGEASSRMKLKPLFSPGFLEKRPRNKLVKREVKSLVQTYEYVSTCAATANDHGLGTPKLPGHQLKDEGISLMDCNDVVPSLHILGDPDSCPNKDEKIDIPKLDSTCKGEHSSETPAERPVDAGDKKFCDPNGICYNGSSSSYSQGQ